MSVLIHAPFTHSAALPPAVLGLCSHHMHRKSTSRAHAQVTEAAAVVCDVAMKIDASKDQP